MYLVEGTVEKSIYDISVQRRLAHMGQVKVRGSGGEEAGRLENRIEAANSMELEQTPLAHLLTKGSGGGEMVGEDDLWNCLFRQKKIFQEAPMEVARHLGADAAEARMRDVSNLDE